MKLTVRSGRARALLLLVVLVLAGAAEAGASMLAVNGTLNPAPRRPRYRRARWCRPRASASRLRRNAGTLISTVEINDPSNPFGVNDLTFIFQVQNASFSTGTITHLSVNGFDNLLVDASYVAAAGQVFPALLPAAERRPPMATRSAPTGRASTGLARSRPAARRPCWCCTTNATSYINGTAAVIGGSITNPSAYIPVPEPASIVLALLGLAAIVAIGRRRRASQIA